MVNAVHRISFLVLIISCACFLSQAQENAKSLLRIGLIADIQYADKEDRGTRFYRTSVIKLSESVEVLNEQNVDFTVVLGDFVDEGPKDLPIILAALDTLKNPAYNLLGNHDFETVQNPHDLYKAFGMVSSYYVVDTAGWRFVFLNTNELSGYATIPNTALEKEYQRMSLALKMQNRTNAQPWNGGVGKKQMKWLHKKLKEAHKKKLNVLVFTHHPLLPEDNGHEALNNREILALLSKHKHVKAVISGHNHKGAFEIHDGLPCITLEGMVETADQNAYGILTLSDDKLTISGMGRMTSRVIDF